MVQPQIDNAIIIVTIVTILFIKAIHVVLVHSSEFLSIFWNVQHWAF